MVEKEKILDLGCGKNKWKNSIGFDCVKMDGVDVVGDLRNPLPFSDNEFDKVILNNVLEHFENITPILKEVHRITKPTGKVVIMVPYYNSPLGSIDPTHKKYFQSQTIQYYTDESSWNYYFDFQFKLLHTKLVTSRIGSFIPKRFLVKIASIFGNLITFIVWIIQPIKN